MPNSSPRNLVGTSTLLAAIIVIAGVCAFIIHKGREDARYHAAMSAIEESKQSIKAIEQKLQEIQQRK